MERRHEIDFLREVVRLAEAHMDDMNSARTTADNKAKVMAGFCIAVLIHLFTGGFFEATAACSVVWWSKIAAVISAIICLFTAVCHAVPRVSKFFTKGLPPGYILSEEVAQSEQFEIDRNIFGGDLAKMLKSLAQSYDERIRDNRLVLEQKGKSLIRAQKFLWPGLILSFIATAMNAIPGVFLCPF